MNGIKAIIERLYKSMLKNVKIPVLMILVPLAVLTLMYLVFDVNNNTSIRLGVPDTMNTTFIEGMPDNVEVITYELAPVLETLLDADDLDAFVTIADKSLNITYKNEDPSKTPAVQQAVEKGVQAIENERLERVMSALPEEAVLSEMEIETSYLYGHSESTFFEKMFPILTGLLIFFFVLLFTSIMLFRERTAGTAERILSTSVRRSGIILGYLTGFGLFMTLQTAIIVLYSIYLLDMNIAGSLAFVFVINILLALSAAAAGIFVSMLANTEFQLMIIILLITVPQVFLSGLIPFVHIGDWFNGIGYGFPLRYAGEALTEVMIKGNGWPYIWNELLALVLFIIGFTVLAILKMKKYRRT